MKVKHIFEDEIYLIKNTAVAKNPMFQENYNYQFFKKKIENYITPLCDIVAYALHENQFEFLVKMKTRETFQAFYKNKYPDKPIDDFMIPESTYIFSQEMANMQSGYVKHFNWLYERSGALFMSRFTKEWIESPEEFQYEIDRINKMEQDRVFNGKWRCEPMDVKNLSETVIRSSGKVYMDAQFFKGFEEEFVMDHLVVKGGEIDLEGQFKTPPKTEISDPFWYHFRQIYRSLQKLE